MTTGIVKRRTAGVAAAAVTAGLTLVFSATVPASAHGASAGRQVA